MIRTLLAVLTGTVVLTGAALAQEAFPMKPVRLIVGYSAGGGNDIIARLIAGRMSEGLGQPVLIRSSVSSR